MLLSDFKAGSGAVLLREMLLLKVKLARFGFVFYSLMSPLIYLAAFGFGFGSRISFDGVRYELFLVQGLISMTSMMNSYKIKVFRRSSAHLPRLRRS